MAEINIQKNEKIKNLEKVYTPLESYKTFLWVLLGVLIASFVFSFGLILLSKITGVELDLFYDNRFVQILMTILSSIVFTIIYFVINKKSGIKNFSQIGLRTKLNFKILIICFFVSVICLFAISPFINMIDVLFAKWGYMPDPNPVYLIDNIGRLFVGIVIMAVLPAITEELLFRGIVLKGLLNKFKPWVAIIISAFLFMLMHGSLQQTVYQFILGLIFGSIAYSSGSIIYSMVAHFFNNALVLIVSYFAPQLILGAIDYTWLWAIFIIVLAILALVLIWFLIDIVKYEISEKKNNTGLNINEYSVDLKSNKKLDFMEQFYMFGGIAIGIIIWLIQTMAG